MTQQHLNIIDYDKLVENSLRFVIKQTLDIVAKDGLPGEHHFYITFLTTYKGVVLPDALLKMYPKEMTIVVQHQFYDLKVKDDSFSITLSFNNISHNLTIPYNAVTYFADPYAKFGLRFNVDGHLVDDEPKLEAQTSSKEDNVEEDDGGSAKIVALDAFRKK